MFMIYLGRRQQKKAIRIKLFIVIFTNDTVLSHSNLTETKRVLIDNSKFEESDSCRLNK